VNAISKEQGGFIDSEKTNEAVEASSEEGGNLGSPAETPVGTTLAGTTGEAP